MPINTNLDPNIAHAIWRKETFPEGSSSIGSFVSGFMGGRSAAQTRSRETSKVDDLNRMAESQGSKGPRVPRPKGNFLTDTMQGFMGARGLEREGQMTPMEKLQQMAQIQGTELSNRSKELELAGTVGDQQTMATFMESMSKDPDYLSNPSNMPVFKTPKYQMLGMGIQRLHNQSTAAKMELKIQSGFFSDMSKLVNVGTDESAAEYRRIKKMVDSNGSPTDEASIALGGALKKLGVADASKPGSTLGKILSDRAAAKAAGRTDEVAIFDVEIAARGLKDGLSIQVDDDGKTIINYGPQASDLGKVTVATQSRVQQKLLKYEGVSQLLNTLEKNMQPEHLGVRGVAGDLLLDRGLSQFIPELANKDRIDTRTGMVVARESLMRDISDDTRFSNADREEIAKALPSSGIFESVGDATQRIQTVRRILNQRGAISAERTGLAIPLWTQTPDQIRALFQDKKISENDAIDALRRFH